VKTQLAARRSLPRASEVHCATKNDQTISDKSRVGARARKRDFPLSEKFTMMVLGRIMSDASLRHIKLKECHGTFLHKLRERQQSSERPFVCALSKHSKREAAFCGGGGGE
jgi:hypothetical protein